MELRNISECIILNSKGEILLQKKTLDYPTEAGGPWCLWGGKIEEGETPRQALVRELKEEVGYGAKSLQHLHTVSMAPAYLEHTIDIILAEQLYPERLMGDEPEELEVVPWSIHQIDALVANGECSEARSIAALFLAASHLRNRT